MDAPTRTEEGHGAGRWMAAAKPSYLGWPIVSSPSGRMICDVAIAPKPDGEADGAWSAHYVEVEANARLIAAAPDLLEALKLILPLAKGYAPEGQTATAKRTCNSWVEAAEEAISRATGASQ